MAKVYGLYVGLLTALTLCEGSLAGWNATSEAPCRRLGNGDNCTAPTSSTDEWNGHFTKCPEKFHHYCINGECRFIKDQEAPSCRCHRGYIGSRCEYVDLDLRRGERQQMIIIVGIVAALVVLILLIVFIFVCSHRRFRICRKRRRQREEPRNGTEKLHMMDTNAHPVTPDSVAPLNYDDV
ncbi:probetacellulin [Syngnathoides biaculeatus]|uniref:probetacellulin n=1 Tax=Syngnathoides biaculeatus TaxID=300417 RepID=UPI002ADE3989|nr:probetacellulin [Syngnathoides biaculeatus]